MRFSEIYGNDALKRRLVKMVDENRLSHAVLFVEQEGMGAVAFAIALSQYLNCKNRSDGDSCGQCSSCLRHQKLTYPDLHFSFPVNSSAKLSDQEKKRPVSGFFLREWNELLISNPYFGAQELNDALGIENKSGVISVNEAREISSTLSLQPYESDYKIMVIWQADKMNAEAANKLLKLLEEPPAGTLFLLVTQNVEKMLPTVLSRCQIIRLQPEDRGDMANLLEGRFGLDKETAMNVATLAGGSVGRAIAGMETSGSDSQNMSLLQGLMDAALAKSLADVLDIADSLAALGKDRQRQWCVYAEGFIRKMFVSAKGLPQIAFADSEEKEYISMLVPRIKETFYDRSAAALDAAIRMIESNVSAKLVFADLGNRFYLYI